MNSPFKFLDAYQKPDKAMFFGRDDEIESLYEKLFETNLLLLYGASGTGKSSLINCGLSNRFQDSDWFSLFVRREDHIGRSLQKHIHTKAITEIPENSPVRKAIRSLYLDYYKPIYLIFDQFEELFILGSKEEQEEFFQTVSELLQAGLQCKIILSMREEYLAYLSDFEKVLPAIYDHRFRVERMNAKNLKEVITGTANHFDIEVLEEDKTVESILENIHDKKRGVDLTNLQVYMDRLYREDYKRRKGDQRAITFDPDLVKETGALGDVLSDFLDEQLLVIENEIGIKGLPLDILLSLVTDNGTKQEIDTRIILGLIEKKYEGVSAENIETCLKRFEDIRILRLSKDES